jgi:glycine cleavage system H protein
VGISDHAQREITDVVYVELPKVGRKVSQGEAMSVVESVKAAFDIYAPISGEVVAVNEAVSKDPALVNRSPYEQGWLFQIRPSRPEEVLSLMDYAHYQEFIKTVAAHGPH